MATRDGDSAKITYLDLYEGLVELDRWREIDEHDDCGHMAVYEVLWQRCAVSRIVDGDTEDLLTPMRIGVPIDHERRSSPGGIPRAEAP